MHDITFNPNANGATVDPSNGTTGRDGKLQSLPTPTRFNHTFRGWFTDATNGVQVDENTVFAADTVVFARWTYDDPGPDLPQPLEQTPPPPSPTPPPPTPPPPPPPPLAEVCDECGDDPCSCEDEEETPTIQASPPSNATVPDSGYDPGSATAPVSPPAQAVPVQAPVTVVAPAIEPEEDSEQDDIEEPDEGEAEEEDTIAAVVVTQPSRPVQDTGLMDHAEPVSTDADSISEEVSAGFFDQEVPLIMIAGREFPLFAPLGAAAWALVNLILCILGVTFAAVTATLTILHRKERAESAKAEKMYNNASASVAGGTVGATETKANSSKKEKDKWDSRQQLAWLSGALLLTIAGVITFLLTQSMMHTMVLVDIWTILHVAFLVAEVVAVMLVFDIAKEVVTFETRGKDRFQKKIRNGKSLGEPKPPKRRGQIFAGWYADDQHTVRWDFQNKIDKTITLYAKWKRVAQ